MEHAWLNNPSVRYVTYLLSPMGPWHKTRIVWGGDYMDEGLFLDEFPDINKDLNTLYDVAAEEFKQLTDALPDHPDIDLVVNHTKREYVSLKGLPDVDGWTIHPLPILASSGNGRGGGDYHGEGPYIGSWAGDVLSAEYEVPEGYTELKPDFIEK